MRDDLKPSQIRFRGNIEEEDLFFDLELLKAKKVHDLKLLILQAVKSRVMSIPTVHFNATQSNVAVLFSGGLDSTILAASLAEVLTGIKDNHVCIDLINVSFSPDTSADRITGIFAYYELKK